MGRCTVCHFKHTLWPNQTKIVTFNTSAKEIVTLWPNWTKIITLNANAKEIVTLTLFCTKTHFDKLSLTAQ